MMRTTPPAPAAIPPEATLPTRLKRRRRRRSFRDLEPSALGDRPPVLPGLDAGAGPGGPATGPRREPSDPGRDPAPSQAPPTAHAAPTAHAQRTELADQGVQSLLLGRNAAGRAEARLRVQCGDAVVEARLSEDARGGVDAVIIVDDDPALADRLAAALDRWAAGPGGDGPPGDGPPRDHGVCAVPVTHSSLAPGLARPRGRGRKVPPRPERVGLDRRRPGVDYHR